MKKNVGNVDGWIRFIVGAVLFILGLFFLSGWIKWIFIVLGAILVLSSSFSFCPIYAICGINTLKKKEEQKT